MPLFIISLTIFFLVSFHSQESFPVGIMDFFILKFYFLFLIFSLLSGKVHSLCPNPFTLFLFFPSVYSILNFQIFYFCQSFLLLFYRYSLKISMEEVFFAYIFFCSLQNSSSSRFLFIFLSISGFPRILVILDFKKYIYH